MAEIYCSQILIYRKAMEKLSKEELIIEQEQQNGATKYIKNPALVAADKATEIILKYLSSLLFTPAALKKLDMLQKIEEDDEF